MKERKEQLKIVHIFLDGRKITDKVFNAERDLTEQQDKKIINSFEDVFKVIVVSNKDSCYIT